MLLDGVELTVVDNDRIELSNIHRQFLYVPADVGKYKVDVIRSKFAPKVDIRTFKCKVQDVGLGEYSKHDMIISSLDNIEGRMHLNYVYSMSSCKHLIDVGTEGYLGHCKVVSEGLPCLYCVKDLYRVDNTLGCSLRHPGVLDETNRHEVIMSLALRAQETHSEVYEYVLDNFNRLAGARGVEGSSIFEIKGVVENIVPSVGYVNSIAAALACINVIEILSGNTISFDFTFLNMNKTFVLNRVQLKKSSLCVLCNN